jgi:hypothetical protein
MTTSPWLLALWSGCLARTLRRVPLREPLSTRKMLTEKAALFGSGSRRRPKGCFVLAALSAGGRSYVRRWLRDGLLQTRPRHTRPDATRWPAFHHSSPAPVRDGRCGPNALRAIIVGNCGESSGESRSMTLTACRISLLGVGAFLALIAIFGEPIREVINFPTGPSHPGFGPTQWTLLVG